MDFPGDSTVFSQVICIHKVLENNPYFWPKWSVFLIFHGQYLPKYTSGYSLFPAKAVHTKHNKTIFFVCTYSLNRKERYYVSVCKIENIK